ncbi:MAG: hypothetical protein HKL84_05530, partial [Acidimicrobiaceae bacterium]|nr:hypothetical protein [Acidimicrobiaceae bacterium]
RFPTGELAGHSLGNLIIAGLTEVTGNFGKAIQIAQELLEVHGSLYPSSLVPIILGARVGDRRVEGQVNIMHTRGIDSIYTDPDNPKVPNAVLRAIASAKTIVAGPGSLFTSVLAVLAVPAIRESINASSAKKIYVVNLKPQELETSGFDISDHVKALVKHNFTPDLILADDSFIAPGDADRYCRSIQSELVICPLANKFGILHDPELLADAFRKYA